MNDTFQFGFRTVGIWNVTLDTRRQRFFYGDADVTDLLSQDQQRRFAGFDVERANRQASDSARIARGEQPYADPQPVSTFEEWIKGVGSDVAELATVTRDAIGIGAENRGNGSPLLRWALGLVLIVLLWKIGALDWVRKKLTA
jgi:hypothetical protein